MSEEWFGTGSFQYEPGDKVLIASREHCLNIKPDVSTSSDLDIASCYNLIGTVKSRMGTGDIKVSFGEDILCTAGPEALVKMRNFLPGDLVKVVDDIRGHGNPDFQTEVCHESDMEICGSIGLVLSNCTDDAEEIDVVLAGHRKTFSRIHLDFVARYLYGEYMARVRQCIDEVEPSEDSVKNVFTVLEGALDDLPAIPMLGCSTPGPFVPGKMVEVSPDVSKFLRMFEIPLESLPVNKDDLTTHNSNPQDSACVGKDGSKESLPNPLLSENEPDVCTLLTKPVVPLVLKHKDNYNTIFRTLQDYTCIVEDGWTESPFPAEQFISLDTPGNVAELSAEGDAIIQFSDGRVWSFHPKFLHVLDEDRIIKSGVLYYRKDVTTATVPEDIMTRQQIVEGITRMILKILNVSKPPTPLIPSRNAVFWYWFETSNKSDEDADKNTTLHYAAYFNQQELLKTLLSLAADINATNKQHRTALHIAVQCGFLDIVRELTDHRHRLDVNIQDDVGNTALHIAIATMNNEIVHWLVSNTDVNFQITNKYKVNALHIAALKGNAWAAWRILYEVNSLINHQQPDQGYAALHMASLRGQYDAVKVLLAEASCAVDLENKHGETALAVAARNGFWHIVESLLLAGADINRVDRHGNTALHMSLMSVEKQSGAAEEISSSRALISVKKRIRDSGYLGDASRLNFACYLVQRGANIDCRNKAGRTPLDIARSLKDPAGDLLQLFKSQTRDPDSGKCENCLEEPAIVSFEPCGHRLYCSDCANRIAICLSCKTDIVSIKTFGTDTKFTMTNRNVVLRAKERKYGPSMYQMMRNPRGICIIINNVDVKGHPEPRKGSELDAQRMMSLFMELHFMVGIEKNLSAQGIRDVLESTKENEIQANADCLVVFLMSHGGSDYIQGSDGKPVNLHEDVYWLFNNMNCPALRGKPKLFFVQACRGSEGSTALDTASDSNALHAAPPKATPDWSDMYIAYATIPNYIALRDTKNGSPFISTIFNVFRIHAATDDLEGLMRRVTERMRRLPDTNMIQMANPVLFGWAKKLYFNP